MRPKDIELHIEELILEGFEENSRQVIGEAVERELSRLLVEKGIPPSLKRGGTIENFDGGAFEMTPDSRAQDIGVKVAQAVYGGLKN